jgi:putative transposase
VSTYRFIAAQTPAYPVYRLCRVLAVATSSYYAWQKSLTAPAADTTATATAATTTTTATATTAKKAETWEQALARLFAAHKGRYGARRLRADLQAEGYAVGRYRVGKALARLALKARQPRAFKPRTTFSETGPGLAPNRLLHRPKPTAPDQVWVSDITYLPLKNGQWAYLAAYSDVFTRRVVGWHVMETMPEELVRTALQRAILLRKPAKGLIVHSDRGGQYCAVNVRKMLTTNDLLASMSRAGDCYDNAQAESLWSRLKTELLEEGQAFDDLAHAQQEIATYFDYYNHRRRHSALGYQCPQVFENQFHLKTTENCPA